MRLLLWSIACLLVGMLLGIEIMRKKFAHPMQQLLTDLNQLKESGQFIPPPSEKATTVIEQHNVNCGARAKIWEDCTCGLFQGWNKPIENINHTVGCPCHCTCDFMQRLTAYIHDTT